MGCPTRLRRLRRALGVSAAAVTAGVTTHTVAATTARDVRLTVTVPTQTTDPATRIHELKVFGS